MKEGYKKTEVGIIPKDWEVKSLGEIFKFSGGLSASRDKLSEAGVNYLHYGDIHKRKETLIDLSSDKEWLPKLNEPFETLKDDAKLYTGDVVFADASEDYEGIGKSVVIVNEDNENFVSGLHTIVGKGGNDLLNTYYKRYCFSTSNVRKQFRKLTTGTSVYGISRENIKRIKIVIPPLKEQEKIAEILSTVDCQIDDTEKLIEKCRMLKKGLMQRLLSRGIGHSEFRMSEVGEIPASWEVKKLGDISIGKGKYGIGASATNYIEGNPRYLRITDIGDSGNLLYNEIKGFDEVNYTEYLLEEGDIVFARTGNTTGKSYAYNKDDGDLVYAGFLIKFKLNSKIVTKDFVKYIVQTKRYWDWVSIMSTRSGQPGINSNEYSDFKLQIPPLEEQIKISDILGTLDNEIVEFINKKQKLNLLRKALMQQLLTGKLRVYDC